MHILWDAVVVGAGPAGMSAALAIADQGLQVALIDEQPRPGGQVFRDVTKPGADARFLDKKAYAKGRALTARLAESSVEYLPNTTVWMIEPGRVFCERAGGAFELKTLTIVVATGAMERPVPFPGWQLPGVMAAGAADILYKSGGIIPPGPIVIAGNGPLLPLVASHLLKLKADIAAIVDTAPKTNLLRAAPYGPAALPGTPLLLEGLDMLWAIRKSGVKTYSGVASVSAHGGDALEEVRFRHGGNTVAIKAPTLLFHGGVIPRTHMGQILRLKHTWNARHMWWQAESDLFGRSSRNGIYIVGDCARVHGEAVATLRGELAGLHISRTMGSFAGAEYDRRVKRLRMRLLQAMSPRPLIDAVFAPRQDLYTAVPDDTLVCRCENVTAGEIRRSVKEGLPNIDDVKLRTRSGMGNCQGRICGPAMTAIAAAAYSCDAPAMGELRLRNPVRPVPLELFASLHGAEPGGGGH